ncbi:hypothetical protein [[Mycobacterium] wendilense]|uniref:Serine/threonine protein kinase n=1 Tax=[Mycobacterium] wendilense TaxID=3064284 RepID=A0ABM9MDT2_9MYCO|nr:hypothetical protein [Mycolicibacterium sp. MU0050]CAJ1582731.1 hypothetical protein MU0050_002254 [Mycolicibacterium sp. MU0050]
MSSRNVLMLTGLGAVLATVALFAGVMTQPAGQRALPAAEAAPVSPTTTTSRAGTDTDELGFISSKARCEQGQSAVALGRTQRSMVAVCAEPDGGYEYRGVRIDDGALLRTSARSSGAGTFVADNEGARYTVSPKALEVTSGGKVIYRDTWAFYEAPSFAAESDGTTRTATPTATATATVTTTVTKTVAPQPR